MNSSDVSSAELTGLHSCSESHHDYAEPCFRLAAVASQQLPAANSKGAHGCGPHSAPSELPGNNKIAAIQALLKALPNGLQASMQEAVALRLQQAQLPCNGANRQATPASQPGVGRASSPSSVRLPRMAGAGTGSLQRPQSSGSKLHLQQQILREAGVPVRQLAWVQSVARQALHGSGASLASRPAAQAHPPAQPRQDCSETTGAARVDQPFAPHRSAALHRTISCASLASPLQPVDGVYALVQARASVELKLSLSMERLEALTVLAVKPQDMALLESLEPHLYDAVLIHARDRHMATRIEALAKGEAPAAPATRAAACGVTFQTGPVRRMMVVVGRAHVAGIRELLSSRVWARARRKTLFPCAAPPCG
ncbi:hypothetical protein QJQ45_010199 [Haematococcus lacustris]|nr:hypothetical protein QJQ45_010199 [Haematococcus lacustris]